MGQTLAQDIIDDVDTVFIDLEHFGELLTFFPADNGPARSVVGIPEHMGQRRDENTHHLTEDTEVEVCAAVNAVTGFTLAELRLGASIRLADDADAVRWDFMSIVAAKTDRGAITARFRTGVMRRQGSRRPPGL
jgi:hypothetical protein